MGDSNPTARSLEGYLAYIPWIGCKDTGIGSLSGVVNMIGYEYLQLLDVSLAHLEDLR